MRSFTIATALSAALFSTASAQSAQCVNNIINNCGFPVTVWSDMTTATGGHVYWQVLTPNMVLSTSVGVEAGGLSFKMKKGHHNKEDGIPPNVLQYEQTTTAGPTTCWYDLSAINGNLGQAVNITLVPSEPTCAATGCKDTDETCTGGAYEYPTDDSNTHACIGENVSFDMTLCSVSGQLTVKGGIKAATSVEEDTTEDSTTTATSATAQLAAKVASKSSHKTPVKIVQGFGEQLFKRELGSRHAHSHVHNSVRRSRVARSMI